MLTDLSSSELVMESQILDGGTATAEIVFLPLGVNVVS